MEGFLESTSTPEAAAVAALHFFFFPDTRQPKHTREATRAGLAVQHQQSALSAAELLGRLRRQHT